MPRVTFIRDHDWQIPGKRGMISFKAGWSGLITTPQAEAARAAGVLAKPARKKTDVEKVAELVERRKYDGSHSPENAKSLLMAEGIHGPDGNLSKEYGG
jgi:hypothetical protein